MGKKDSSTEMEKIGKLIYKDLGHPALSQVGNAVGSLIRLVALPITFLGLTAEELEKKYAKFIQKTLEKVPEKKRIDPKAVVAAPLLDHVKFVFDEENLSEMFSNLLANAMMENVDAMVHPAFAEMLKQLSPLDAEFMFLYFKDEDIVEQEDIKWKYGEGQLSLTIESLLRLGIINGITYDNRDDVAYALTDFGKLFRDLCLMTPTDIEQDEFVFQDEQNNAYISGKYAFSDTFGTVRKSEKNGHLYIRHKFSIEDVDNGSQIAVVFRVYNNYSEEKSLERVYLESQRGKIYAAENKMPVTIKPKKFFDCIFAIKSKQMLEELESGNGKYVIQEGKMIYEMSVTEATRREIAVYLKYFKEDN